MIMVSGCPADSGICQALCLPRMKLVINSFFNNSHGWSTVSSLKDHQTKTVDLAKFIRLNEVSKNATLKESIVLEEKIGGYL